MVTSPKIKYFMAIPLVTTVKWLQLVTLEWYMKHPLGSQQKKTSDVSWNAFGRFTQCRHHQSGNVPRKHLPKPTTGTHPRRLQNSPYVHFVVICSFNGPQRLQGEQKTPVPHVRCFGKTSSKSHFLPSFVEAKPLPSARKIPIRGGNFCFQRVTKGSCTWHGFRNRNVCFSRDLIFLSSFRSWTSKGCNLKVSGLGQLKTPYHLGDLDFLGLRFLLFLRAEDL